MSALDQITGLIPVTLASGIVLKVTEKALPQNGYAAPGRRIRGQRHGRRAVVSPRRRSPLGFGNFSNIGL